MASTTPHLVYSEDVVEHPTNQDMIGVVLQNAQSSDEDLSSSEEDEQLEKGHCIVAWYPKGLEEEMEEDKLKVTDRCLLPGDVVRWLDPTKPQQKGYIKSVNVKVDLKVTGTNYTMSGIDCGQLKPLQDFFTGLVVVYGPWMGIIREVYFALVVRLKNGSRCTVKGESVNLLVDTTDQRDEDSPFYCFGFYPGQHVNGPAKVFKEADWISGTRPILGNNQRVRAIVEEASIFEVNVDWQVCGYVGDVESPAPPNETMEGPEVIRLKALNHFREARIQVGDKAFYTLSNEDVTSYWHYVNRGKTQAASGSCDAMRNDQCSVETPSASAMNSDTPSKQSLDGASGYTATTDMNIRETPLSSSEGSADEDDREEPRSAPAAPIASRRSDARHGPAFGQNRGYQGRRRRHVPRRKRKRQISVKVAPGEKVCCEVCRTRTLVSIIWQDGSEEGEVSSTDVIPILHLDELEFFPGDFVVDKRVDAIQSGYGVVKTANSRERICQILWMPKPGSTASSPGTSTETLSVYDIADHSDYNFRPGDCVVQLEGAERSKHSDGGQSTSDNPGVIGQVIHVTTEGKVEVVWSDGCVSALPCHQIFVVHREDDDDGGDDYSSEGSSDDDSEGWETASDSSEDANVENLIDPLEDIIMRSLAALGNQRNDQEPSQDAAGEQEQTDEVKDSAASDNMASSTQGQATSLLSPGACASGEESVSQYDHFTMLECANAAHHFYGNVLTPANPRQFMSVIRRELKLLQSSLSSGIHICAYEDRLDLFSVLIEGSPGTPYEGGMFAFDLQLSDNYPKSPPSVHYISYCTGRLNPNLYEDGTVCVSLLGTWSGKGTETWTSKSNLCQVVLSLQGLILCEEPYFNEAGYEKHKGTEEGRENSRMYNEMAIIKLLQSIEGMIRNPPYAFKEQVHKYFSQNLQRLVCKFRSWISIYGPEGTQASSSDPSVEYPLFPLSHGFCLTLQRTLDRLESAMERLPH